MALTKVIGAGVGNLDELGVGTASPSYKLHSVTTSGSDYAGFFHNSSGSGNGTALVVKGGANNTGAGTFIVQDYSGNTDLMVDGNGHVTMPNQSAFMVDKDGTNQDNLAINAANAITWSTERFDQNGDFASNTFTAPVTGKYQLSVTMRFNNVDSAASYYNIYLLTSNRNYYQIFDPTGFSQDLNYWFVQMSVLADMDANDTASLSIYQAGGTAQTDVAGAVNYTKFMGYLVC